ncbi:uncharacterized protein DUF3108 [Marinoscillum furvescens DSM 4134]|uniref:Uncharacterized protein DUF3108 n=2 Tax=Marinoscillum furvescens TaxID=1026 RepID=A0A3D9L039_MARFU|nr:uncharacterized protein DUF3108 [Marinoscillum furvescens DSM 4134]
MLLSICSGQRLTYMLIIVLLLSLLSAGAQPTSSAPVDRHNFKKGEHLEFKLSYGWFTVGKASLDIDNNYHPYQNTDCFKVDVKGSTAGLLGVFTHVDDRWGAYVRKDNLLPLHAYRDIEEGKYMRVERTYFDHEAGKVEVLRYDPRKEQRKPKRVYEIQGEVYDLMSSYLYLRNLNFSQYSKGDTIRVKTFYEDELYNFRLVYDGKETMDSKVGEISAHRLYFLIPPSDIFPNEKGIIAWISADPNHLPLRIEAEMFFGKAYCDLTSYRNIKYGPDYQ